MKTLSLEKQKDLVAQMHRDLINNLLVERECLLKLLPPGDYPRLKFHSENVEHTKEKLEQLELKIG